MAGGRELQNMIKKERRKAQSESEFSDSIEAKAHTKP